MKNRIHSCCDSKNLRKTGHPEGHPPKEGSAEIPSVPPTDSPANFGGCGINRRGALGRILGLPVAGAVAGALAPLAVGMMPEERVLLAKQSAEGGSTDSGAEPSVDAVSGATRTTWELPKIAELVEPVPKARIGSLEVSRLLLGGNLIGGWAHSRDLVYVSELVKQYHTKEKVFQTFQLAEKCGINTFMGNPIMNTMMEEYWRWTDGKMQFISDCGGGGTTMPDNVRVAIDFGCDACYIHGGFADNLVAEGRFAILEECFQIMRDAGLPAGVGAHYQSTVDGIVAAGLAPDFWMKTYHHLNYWSAKTATEHDNVFCREPEETVAFMATTDKPWIAFKTLAAGAILPEDGFRSALEGGADFLCVGMYDFQMVDDVNLFCRLLNNLSNRTRRMLENLPAEPIG